MDRQRVEQALARIEAAAARIEAGSKRAQPALPLAGDAELAKKHTALRAEVHASLRELDALIGVLEDE